MSTTVGKLLKLALLKTELTSKDSACLSLYTILSMTLLFLMNPLQLLTVYHPSETLSRDTDVL